MAAVDGTALPATPAQAPDDVSPWGGMGASREATNIMFEADGTVRTATDVTIGGAGDGPATAGDAAAAAAADDGADDDTTSTGSGWAVGERKRIRKMLKGTTIYFEAASPRDVVLVNAVESGCSVVHKEEKGDVIWIEATPKSASYVRALEHQRINFFPGMKIAASKCTFSTLMARISRFYPGDFPFVPQTFALPTDRAVFDEHCKSLADQGRKPVFVVKPDGGCGGDGIYLTDEPTKLKFSECVVQHYVTNPLTIGGLKFDFRLYVLVTSIYPLRFYIHREGLGRMATQKYETPSKSNFYKLNMHLTNYSLNKFSNDFIDNTDPFDDDHTTKRRASTAMRQLSEEYGDRFDEEGVWDAITELVGKTLGVIAPHILAAAGELPGQTRHLTRCFQIVGFDVLLDTDMKPHLLEINNHPSLQTDAPIDMHVKTQVVRPMVRMVCLDARTKRRGKKGSEFVAPSDEAYAEWEDQFTSSDDPGQFLPCDTSTCTSITARYIMPLVPLLQLFIDACGGARSRTYDSLTSSRFAKLARKLDLSGPGKAFQTPEIDLLFIKCLQKRGGGNTLDFYDFVDALCGPIGDRVSPHTPNGSLQRLRDVTQLLCTPA